ncbi:hypothetical protein Tco_0393882 [Tanacetum coccineum]
MGDRPAQTRFERLSKQSNEPPLSRVNTLESGEDSMKLQELMDLCTKLSDRVLDLENVKDAQALEIKKSKKRVKKLESKKKSRTPQLKRRLFKVRIESSVEKSLCDLEDPNRGGMKLTKIKGFHGFKRMQRLRGAKLDEEARLEREKEEEANKATNIVEWDDIQAMMDVNYELATKLQEQEREELTIEERSKLFVEIMNERKKHFARLRAEE